MITFSRVEGDVMIFAVAGNGVNGECQVPIATSVDLDDKDAMAAHIEAARVGLCYELCHKVGRHQGRFAPDVNAHRRAGGKLTDADPSDVAAHAYCCAVDERAERVASQPLPSLGA